VSPFPIDPTRECIDIITIGRRSGREHRVEIWFGMLDGDVCLLSGNGPGADWFRNALVDSRVTIDVDGETFVGRARVPSSGEERAAIGAVMRAKYPWEGDPSIGLTFDAWCDEVPALVISRVE
jgi:hypothetical protein